MLITESIRRNLADVDISPEVAVLTFSRIVDPIFVPRECQLDLESD